MTNNFCFIQSLALIRFLNISGSYAEAYHKAKRAEDTSDIQTEEENSKGRGFRKYKIFRVEGPLNWRIY